jgi:hypothetical protein
MSSTSPTPDEASGRTPAPKPLPSLPVPPEPQAAPLDGLTPPIQPDPQQEPTRTLHHIMGQRLVIEYETAQLGDREAFVSAVMRLLPPFGSSSTRSAPYTIRPCRDDLTVESRLIELLHELRDSREALQDLQIIRELRRLRKQTRGVAILDEAIPGSRLRRAIPHMTYSAPPFDVLDTELTVFGARYLSSRVQNGIYQECMCQIHPKHNAVWAHFKEGDDTAHLREIEVIGASKDLPPNISEDWAKQLAWKNLTGIAEGTMKIFQAYGARCAMSTLKNALPHGKPPNEKNMPVGLDDRLRLGIVRDFALDTIVTLPSGGKAILDVGDHVAALSISASDQEDCSSICLVFDSKASDYLGQNWESHLDETRSRMQKLVSTSAVVKGFTLDRLLTHAIHVFHRRCTMSHIVGEQAAESLAALDDAGFLKAWLPNTASAGGRYELLQGYERVELTLAHFPGTQENLAAFSSVQLLVGPTGNIDLYLGNQLRSRLRAVLSEKAVSDWGGVGKVIMSLALALSTRDIAQADRRVHQLLEKMAAPGLKQSTESELTSIDHEGLPPNSELERRTFALALGVAQAAHSASNCYGNHAVHWLGSSRAVAVIQLVPAMYAIEFEVEGESIREVVLRGQAYFPLKGERVRCLPTLRFALPPAVTPLLVQALPEIFADYYQFGGPGGYFSPESESLERTKILKFLTAHAQRISGNRRRVDQRSEED